MSKISLKNILKKTFNKKKNRSSKKVNKKKVIKTKKKSPTKKISKVLFPLKLLDRG